MSGFNENVDLNVIKVAAETPPSLVEPSTIDNLVNKIVSSTSTTTKLTEDEVSVGLAIICQKGGTAKNANSNIYAVVNGKKLDLGTVRKAMTDINWKHTLRQFARTKGAFIYTVASKYSIPGDLSQKLGHLDSSLTQEELYWLSNFQMNTPSCPSKVKVLLKNHFDQLFNNNP